MKDLNAIRALIFDLDGVLVFTDKLHYAAWKQLADKLGIYFDETINDRLRGVSRMESLEIILERHTGEPFTDREKAAFAEEKNENYKILLKTMTPASVADEVRQALQALRERGYKLAVGSSSRNTPLILDRTGLLGAFDAVADGNCITYSKPHPEVFLRAASALGVPPEECAVIEDAEAGIDAANAAGMLSIGIGGAAEYEKADCKISAVSDLLGLFTLPSEPYDPALAALVIHSGETIQVNGVPVEVKPVPDGDGKPRLDRRALRRELEMSRRMASIPRDAPPPPIEVLRESMGGVNYNLNREEIFCRYIEVETSWGKVPVWGYYPRHMRGPVPSLLYVHGGAFFAGTPFTTANPCKLVAERANCIVWNMDYSLPPEHPYPIPCTQVYEVLAYLHDHAREFDMDPDKIAVGGDSAGGNMSAACVQMDRDKGTHYAAGNVLLYAKLTFTNHLLPGYQRDESVYDIVPEEKHLLPGMLRIGSDESNAGDERNYVQGRYDLTEPYISPCFGKKEGLPKTLILLAEYDGLRLEGEFYAGQLQGAGVPFKVVRYRGVCHGFFDLTGILPQAEAACQEIADFLRGL